jgi:nucleotide-binding universal stress UspA family protein
VTVYKRILVPLEHSGYDAAIVAHVRDLAKASGASVVLIHVADGWAARHVNELHLRESAEMRSDREYLERVAASLNGAGVETESLLAAGNPGREIVDAAEREGCDLIAMATHGHKFLNDLMRGSVANDVRHIARIPVLMLRAEKQPLAPDGRRITGEHAAMPHHTGEQKP